jgi:hypothetical protein
MPPNIYPLQSDYPNKLPLLRSDYFHPSWRQPSPRPRHRQKLVLPSYNDLNPLVLQSTAHSLTHAQPCIADWIVHDDEDKILAVTDRSVLGNNYAEGQEVFECRLNWARMINLSREHEKMWYSWEETQGRGLCIVQITSRDGCALETNLHGYPFSKIHLIVARTFVGHLQQRFALKPWRSCKSQAIRRAHVPAGLGHFTKEGFVDGSPFVPKDDLISRRPVVFSPRKHRPKEMHEFAYAKS